jgi:lipopolysaccharide biosynthesis glycosyltransferase
MKEDSQLTQIISILHCFDDNFVIPAGVAIHSLLRHADPTCHYRINILHSNITPANQSRLRETVADFKNATLEFIGMNDRFAELFENTKTKAHYSKEMFYKFLACSIFPNLEKILVSDVDVVFQGDVSRDFLDFPVESDFYLASSPSLVREESWVAEFSKGYERDFTLEEIRKLKFGAGYYIANLKLMREDGLEEQFLRCARDNAWRLLQPEQDVINLVCFPKIVVLPADSMVCTYSYDFYREEADFERDLNYTGEEVRRALSNPIQLHYAGSTKPWNKPDSVKSDVWFEALTHTPFLKDHLAVLGRRIEEAEKYKELFSFRWPLSRRRIVVSRVKIT